jgi:hypothetical protein
MLDKTNLYFFVSLTTQISSFVSSNDIKYCIEKNKISTTNQVLFDILQNKYSYQLIELNVLKTHLPKLIHKYTNNRIEMLNAITKTRLKIEYESRKQVGMNTEKLLQPILEKVFNTKLIKTPNQYDLFDFTTNDLKYFFEIKTTPVINSAIVGVNKCCVDNLIIVFFCSKTHLIYYIKYNKTIFDTFQIIDIILPSKIYPCPTYVILKKYLTQINVDDNIIL